MKHLFSSWSHKSVNSIMAGRSTTHVDANDISDSLQCLLLSQLSSLITRASVLIENYSCISNSKDLSGRACQMPERPISWWSHQLLPYIYAPMSNVRNASWWIKLRRRWQIRHRWKKQVFSHCRQSLASSDAEDCRQCAGRRPSWQSSDRL